MPKKVTKAAAPAVRRSPMEHPRHQYPQETQALQRIAASCGLAEKIKWGKPCYVLGNKNIVLIQRFKEYIALMFFKGALLKDPGKLLSRIGEHMQAPRQFRFTSVAEIEQHIDAIRDFIAQAIDLEESGSKVVIKKASELEMPEELRARLKADTALGKAFAALTPGRQKGYIYGIASAKQTATRASRVEKYIPKIMAGNGLQD